MRRELKGLPPKSRKIDLACMYRTGATGSLSEVRDELGMQAVKGLQQVRHIIEETPIAVVDFEPYRTHIFQSFRVLLFTCYAASSVPALTPSAKSAEFDELGVLSVKALRHAWNASTASDQCQLA